MDEKFKDLINHPDFDLVMDGLTIRVKDGVFSPDPASTNSTSIILKNLPPLSGKRVLDIGSGTGIIALRSALNGATVIAVDVSEKSVENIQENIARLKLTGKVEVRHSDLFSNVPERFDYIFANLPILDEAWAKEAGSSLGLVRSFLNQLPQHLNQNGKAFLAWGSFADVKPVRELLRVSGLPVREIIEESHGYTWYLFEIAQ